MHVQAKKPKVQQLEEGPNNECNFASNSNTCSLSPLFKSLFTNFLYYFSFNIVSSSSKIFSLPFVEAEVGASVSKDASASIYEISVPISTIGRIWIFTFNTNIFQHFHTFNFLFLHIWLQYKKSLNLRGKVKNVQAT
ncbi:hypothetical protein HanIR_Chr16g0834631 [Helianthus annuus]|nr:hypothetical protein HanIR_Chr16g0834631 [Helianthus annuus]